MKRDLSASVLINNYNYDKFLYSAVNSALSQTYGNVEVIVVDDGSTDGSREIIAGFGDRITAVFKQNGGQASAFNEGFKRSTGEVIFFLDSDDLLYPDAVENAIKCFKDENIAKVHWPLEIINEEGETTGELTPKGKLPEGDFKEHALKSGPPFFLNPPTSGNAWSREFLESVMPMPEKGFRIGADTYLFETVPFFGLIRKIDQPLASYRIHQNNNYNNKIFTEKLHSELEFYNSLFGILGKYCQKLGLASNEKIWREKSWFHRVAKAMDNLRKIVSDETSFILIDEGMWDVGKTFEGRRVHSFIEKNGAYAGVPLDDEQAISQLQVLQRKGASYLVFTWMTFWWLDHYPNFAKYLREVFECVLEDDNIIVFKLNNNNAAASL